jgi:hypothetical protein
MSRFYVDLIEEAELFESHNDEGFDHCNWLAVPDRD